MTEQEAKDLAQRIADDSEIFDFDLALEFVQYRPAETEKLVRNREEMREAMERLDRAYEGLHRAAREFR
jgi:hypothetical protein